MHVIILDYVFLKGKITWLTDVGFAQLFLYPLVYFMMKFLKENKILISFFENFKGIIAGLRAVGVNLGFVSKVLDTYNISGFPVCLVAGYLQSKCIIVTLSKA